MPELVKPQRPEFITVVLNQQGRSCFGRLYFGGDGLRFLCLKDESAAAAAAGQAAARQFGLLGALAGAAVGAVKASARDKAIAEVLAAQEGMPLEQRLQQHPLSRTFLRDDLVRFHVSSWTGTVLETREGKVPVMQLDPQDAQHLKDWCEENGVPAMVAGGMSSRAKLALVLAPVALVLVYVLAAVPFAVRKASHGREVKARYEAMLQRAESTFEALEKPVGADLERACAAVVPELEVEGLVGYVGDVPGQEQTVFPMVVTASDHYVFDDQVADAWWGDGGFGDAYESILTEAPTDWEGRVMECYPRCAAMKAKTLVVTRVWKLGSTRSGETVATLSSRVLSLESGKELCAGDLDALLTSGSSMSDGVRDASLLALCKVSDGLCDAVSEHALRAARRY